MGVWFSGLKAFKIGREGHIETERYIEHAFKITEHKGHGSPHNAPETHSKRRRTGSNTVNGNVFTLD